MNFHVLTLFPEMIRQGMEASITGRALKQNLISLNPVNIRDFTQDKHRRVDDYTYGGGAGMLMQAQPVYDAFQSVWKQTSMESPKVRTIYVTPQGLPFTQQMAENFSHSEDLIFLCGHYEGIDERVLEEIVTDYVSIGDYVLTGGELPAMVMMDAISRLVPGVLNNEDSAETESFHGSLLEYPQYSRPEVWHEKAVPQVLLSGNQKEIAAWRLEESVKRTRERRPDLYQTYQELDLAQASLKKQKLQHMDMLAVFERGHAKLWYRDDTEIFLQDNRSLIGYHCLLEGSESKIPLDQWKELLGKCHGITVHQACIRDFVEEKLGWKTTCTCFNGVCTRKEKLPVSGLYRPDGKPMANGLVIRQAGMEALPVMLEHYTRGDDADYLEGQIKAGLVYGAYIGDQLCGFIGEHCDGSIGMLTVLPEYRRMHLAMALETYMCNLYLGQGRTPFGQVIEGNQASLALQEKLGMYRSPKTVWWMR